MSESNLVPANSRGRGLAEAIAFRSGAVFIAVHGLSVQTPEMRLYVMNCRSGKWSDQELERGTLPVAMGGVALKTGDVM